MAGSSCTSCFALSLVFIALSSAAPDVKTPSSGSLSWHRTQQPQTLHGLMVSIDERLRSMDNVRWDLVLEQIDRRLEVLETRMRRLDTSLQDRFDKIDRNLNSRELKEELSEEKMSHKIRDVVDTGYDRYNRRLGYTEERLELSFKKLQTNVEGLFNRIEKHQEDIQSELMDVATTLDDIKTHSVQSEDKFNTTHKSIQQHLNTILSESASRDQLQKITGSLEHIGSRLNSSGSMWGSQSDGPHTIISKDFVESIRQEISTENNNLGVKISNTYNDLWRRFVSLESLIKDVIKHGNSTQREILEELRSFLMVERRDYLSDSQENFLEIALDALERKIQKRLSDLGRKFDDKFDTLSATQNLVIDSCFEGGVCRGLESRVSQVLEKIIVMFTTKIDLFSNRTDDMDSLLLELMELVKSQHSQMIRTVTHTTNMVVTLTKDSSDANKHLQSTVIDLADRTETTLQELQEEIQEIANISGKLCTELEKTSQESVIEKTELTNLTLIETTENTLNETRTKENSGFNVYIPRHKPNYDEGVVKITSDNLATPMNKTHVPEQTDSSTENKTKEKQKMYDDSTLHLIELLNSNLTNANIQILLRFLNNTINLKTIEAIIQNTESEPNDDGMLESNKEISFYENKLNFLNNDEQNEDENTSFIFSGHTSDADSVGSSTHSSEKQLGSIQNTNEQISVYENKTLNDTAKNNIMDTNNNGASLHNKRNATGDNYKEVLQLITKLHNGTLNVSNEVNTTLLKFTLRNFLQILCAGIEKDTIKEENKTLTILNRLQEISTKTNNTHLYNEVENICKLYTNVFTEKNLQQFSKRLVENNNNLNKNVVSNGSQHENIEDSSFSA